MPILRNSQVGIEILGIAACTPSRLLSQEKIIDGEQEIQAWTGKLYELPAVE